MQLRRTLEEEFELAFKAADVLLVPTTPSPPPPSDGGGGDGGGAGAAGTADAVQAYAFDVMTVPASLCGLPAVSVPVPGGAGRHPCSVQLIARKGGEAALLRVALALEQSVEGGS